MTDCAMYNLTFDGTHPSTICVEISKLIPSLESIYEMIGTEYLSESLADFITEFARTDEIMPEDHTMGFVIVNSKKKHLSLAFNGLPEKYVKSLREIGSKIVTKGYEVEYDLE